MKHPEPYWTYQGGLIPEIKDLPAGSIATSEEQFASLSPGMRREIYRQAMRRLQHCDSCRADGR